MTASSTSRVRTYHTVRTAHLERSLELEPADLVYGQRRYDFDEAIAGAVAARARLEQASDLRLAWLLLRRGYIVVEVNEPIALETVRRTALAMAAIGLSDAFRRRRTTVVTYAIGNVPLKDLPRPGGKARMGRWLDERVAPFVWRRTDRAVFGTRAARSAYQQSFGAAAPRTAIAMIPAISAACTCLTEKRATVGDANFPRLLFLGDLSVRKGFDLVVHAWSNIRDLLPDAEFVIVGRGSLTDVATKLAAADERVSLIIDPPRRVVHEQLRRASVVVLPSQPNRGWREQVGLPLVEGLAHGCTVVTTKETGIADWLGSHGHQTVPAQDAAAQLPKILTHAIRNPIEPETVLGSLPERDGRLEADAWMFCP